MYTHSHAPTLQPSMVVISGEALPHAPTLQPSTTVINEEASPLIIAGAPPSLSDVCKVFIIDFIMMTIGFFFLLAAAPMIGSIASSLLFLVLAFCIRMRIKAMRAMKHAQEHSSFDGPSSQACFKYEDLKNATNGFSQLNVLGKGGFGNVYKGVLPDGRVVAIKKLKTSGCQGEKEFQAEIKTISQIHHRHLVSLLGFCTSKSDRLLVYEFVPNSTLQYHIHENNEATLSWTTRMKIEIGSAKGLAYLHIECQPRIIHRDVKPTNILLDENFEAKIADFGLAKVFLDTYTHVFTRVIGTIGYMAPEYASTGKLTERSDVYSFGVVLLELISGRPVIQGSQSDKINIVNWAQPLLDQAWKDGTYGGLVDPNLHDYDPDEMLQMVYCASACVRHSAYLRPEMSQILQVLQANRDLKQGMTPGNSRALDSNLHEEWNELIKQILDDQSGGESNLSHTITIVG